MTPPSVATTLEKAESAAKRATDSAFDEYAPAAERPPLGSYAALTALFNGGLAAFLVGARRGRYELPSEISTKDLALIGVASHKLSRLVTKAKVTSFARAPFRRYEGKAGPDELSEETRGEGPREAVGDFIGCPYCMALWVSAGLTMGLTVAPRETRFVSTIFAGLAISDFMQLAYAIGQGKLRG